MTMTHLVHTVFAHNVNHALRDGLWRLAVSGELHNSRNGGVLVLPSPCITTYGRPDQRVLFLSERDANPFFHLMEAMWMLSGRQDVQTPATFAKQILAYSDDGVTMNAAYGHRWREHFGFDQIQHVVRDLKKDITTRRAVVAIWDGRFDLISGAAGSKDLPCNTTVYLSAYKGVLDMTLCNRSNDVVWGAYGANAVHFSVLQELIAGAVGVPLGVLHQLSNNYHVYVGRPDVERLIYLDKPTDRWCVRAGVDDRYQYGCATTPLWGEDEKRSDIEWWLDAVEDFFSAGQTADEWHPQFLQHTVHWVAETHRAYREGFYDEADKLATQIRGQDWRTACQEWLARRRAVREEKAAKVTASSYPDNSSNLPEAA